MQTNKQKGTGVPNCLEHSIHRARPSLERILFNYSWEALKNYNQNQIKQRKNSTVLVQRLEDGVALFPSTFSSFPLSSFLWKQPHCPICCLNDRGSPCPQTKFIHQSVLGWPRHCLKALLKYLFQQRPSYAATLKNRHFLKKLNVFTTQSSKFTPRYLSKGNENICPTWKLVHRCSWQHYS